MNEHLESESFAEAAQQDERNQTKIRAAVITICVLILAVPVSVVTLICVRPCFGESSRTNSSAPPGSH